MSESGQVALLAPVEGERIELVAPEIHHREQCVHKSVAQPALCVLADTFVGVPSETAEPAQVLIFSYWRAAHLYPWLHRFHPVAYGSHYVCDVGASLLPRHLHGPRLVIADVVEVYAVNVVVGCYLGAKVCQIFGCLLFLRVHVSFRSYLTYESGMAFAQPGTSGGVPFAYRYCHHPCVKLHAPAVTLVDGELQCVVSGTLARLARQTSVPRLVCRGIDCRGSDACL